MATERPKYCIDTCVYIDWLKKPTADIEDVILEVEKNEAILLAPVIVYTEIVEAHNPGKQFTKFREFLKRSNVVIIDIAMPLADKAETIRSAAWNLKPKRSIKTPDALFIAASILFGATMLLTRDDKLLKLSGHRIVDGLTISLPRTASGKRSIPGTVSSGTIPPKS